MTIHSIKYGIDRCPATKNYSHILHCRNCDFRSSEKKDCCECVFYRFGEKSRQSHKELH